MAGGDKKFTARLVRAEEDAGTVSGYISKRKVLFSVTDEKLFTNAQKLHFSNDGTLFAIGSKCGCRISVLKVITDDSGCLLDMSLVAICYRGFRSCNLKEISFSPSLDHMIVTADSGTIHMFNIKAAHEDRPINIVRKEEIRSFMKLKVEDLLFKTTKCEKECSSFSKITLTAQNQGNVTVPGVKFISESAHGNGRPQFVVQVSSRWGFMFEVLFKCTGQGADWNKIDSYQIINVYNLMMDKPKWS